MRRLKVSIGHAGAFIDVEIGICAPRRKALHRAGLPIPDSVKIPMLIDTGATHTFVDGIVLAEKLQLTASGKYNFHSASTQAEKPDECYAYDVCIALGVGVTGQQAWRIDPFTIMACNERRQHGLLGLDILAKAQMEWNGPTGELVLLY